MRLYKGKLLALSIADKIAQHVESRDAILWDVLPTERKARVKIQGSATLIIAYYPENWEKTPVWLKPGNAVRISHTGGNQGRIELVGHGAYIPTPVAEDTQTPPGVSYSDLIIEGMKIVPNGGMSVYITAGKVRFDGAITTVAQSDSININTAPSSGNYRYDLITIDSAFAYHYIAGTPSNNPVKPAVPNGNILVGYILVPYGLSTITANNINNTFAAPTITSLTMAISDNDMAWADPATTNVAINVKDQYGHDVNTSGVLTLAIIDGNGTVAIGGNSSADSVSINLSGSNATFTYTRGKANPGDSSPMLLTSLLNRTVYGYIILRDSLGNVM